MSDNEHELNVRWSASAQKAFLNTLDRIAEEDSLVASQVLKRVGKSIVILAQQPGLGTFTALPGVRRFSISQYWSHHRLQSHTR